jgi:hypothetical protein
MKMHHRDRASHKGNEGSTHAGMQEAEDRQRVSAGLMEGRKRTPEAGAVAEARRATRVARCVCITQQSECAGSDGKERGENTRSDNSRPERTAMSGARQADAEAQPATHNQQQNAAKQDKGKR